MSFIYKMKLFFNKIYYAFSKTERGMNLTKRKGDFSWGLLLDIFEGFELGISFALASLPTFLFIRNSFEYIVAIPFVILFCIFILLRRTVNKRKWEELDRSLWKQFDNNIDIPEWIAIGIITAICSIICAIGGGLLFFLSIFHIYE